MPTTQNHNVLASSNVHIEKNRIHPSDEFGNPGWNEAADYENPEDAQLEECIAPETIIDLLNYWPENGEWPAEECGQEVVYHVDVLKTFGICIKDSGAVPLKLPYIDAGTIKKYAPLYYIVVKRQEKFLNALPDRATIPTDFEIVKDITNDDVAENVLKRKIAVCWWHQTQ